MRSHRPPLHARQSLFLRSGGKVPLRRWFKPQPAVAISQNLGGGGHSDLWEAQDFCSLFLERPGFKGGIQHQRRFHEDVSKRSSISRPVFHHRTARNRRDATLFTKIKPATFPNPS